MEDYKSKNKRCVLIATIAAILNILLFVAVMIFVFFYVYEINPLDPVDDTRYPEDPVDDSEEDPVDDSEEDLSGMFTYSVDDDITNADVTHTIDQSLSGNGMFIDYMEQAANINSNFTFSARYYSGGLGYYITSIGGLDEDIAAEMAWVFMKREDTTDCIMPVGVSSYSPMDGDHIIMAYASFDIYNTAVNCQTGDAQPHVK